MEQNQKQERAKYVFGLIRQMLDAHDWRYQPDEENLKIKTGARGDDLPMEMVLYVDEKLDRVQLISPLLFDVQEDKRLDMAIAICNCNNGMVQGCFDYDISDGSIFFRMSNSYADSTIDPELFYHMLMIACITVDQYNDQLMMLGKGIISIEQFLKNQE